MANNKLVKTNVDKLTRTLDTPGLFVCNYEYEVKSAVGALTYTGPKIDPGEWAEVVAFFRWVNDTSHSEAQVRMFFDPDDNRIFFYAFPQAKNTGLTARELDTEDARAQRASLPNAANLINMGTVHSHCSVSAFQSGTDEANEIGQDGIHITVGHLHQDTLSLHARFYRKKDLFDPDLSKFWDIGNSLSSLPEGVISMLPADAEDKMARSQMCKAPPKEQTFPEQWRNNIVEPPRIEPTWVTERPIPHYWRDGEYRPSGNDVYQRQGDSWVYIPNRATNTYQPEGVDSSKLGSPPWNGQGYLGNHQNQPAVDKSGTGKRRKKQGKDLLPLGTRVADALKEIIDASKIYQIETKDVEEAIGIAAGDELFKTIVQVCKDYEIVPDDLDQAFQDWQLSENLKALSDIHGEHGLGQTWGGY